MNKFLTFQGQQPLYLGDIDFASAAVRSAFAQLVKGLIGSDSANAIISGVNVTRGTNSFVFSEGVVCIDGEILPVEECELFGDVPGNWYFRIKSEYSGTREFVGGETHDCWETRTVEVTSESTDYPFYSFRRLSGGFGSQIWSRTNEGEEFHILKTGLVWLVTVKRGPMTRSDVNFFEIEIGLPAEELAKFPSTEESIIATAYKEGSGEVTAELLRVSYEATGGNLHIVMDLLGTGDGNLSAQFVLPVF